MKQSTQEIAAKELASYLCDKHQKYIARIYDRYHAVLPAKSNDPAFQHGKFSIIPNEK